MEPYESLLKHIEKSIRENWDLDALTDYEGITLQYKDVARKIEKLHILFEYSGIQQGDKIALYGRNSAAWAAAYLAILTYGAVAVPILHEFTPEQVHDLVNHSEARLLFVGDFAGPTINPDSMPHLDGIINIPDYSLRTSRVQRLTEAREHLNEIFGKKYPKAFRAEHISYHEDQPEELALINYTSGTTSQSKGVMIPYRAVLSNLLFAKGALGANVQRGGHVISILPLAHMYGMAFEFLFEFCKGCHIFFLTRIPSPRIVFESFQRIKPSIVIAVPLIIEKIIRKSVMPKLQTPKMKMLLKIPVINQKIREEVCDKVRQAFGGNFYELIIGGAALNSEVEEFLYKIGLNFTVGYGATECAPIIAYADWKEFRPQSCGKVAPRMQIKIDSVDPYNVVGEILCKGDNVMLGYYKNEEATQATLTHDGWYHTGDLGVIDTDGYLYIKGRSKNMLLGPSGQNIYPEEIENKLNTLPLVSESIVIQKDTKLYALIHPDYEEAHSLGLEDGDLENVMEQNRKEINVQLPSYSQLAGVKVYQTEFEKTPKRSIKRFLYANVEV